MKENKDLRELENYIKEEMDMEEIPESLNPEHIKMSLKKTGKNTRRIAKIKAWSTVLATAACLAILVTSAVKMGNRQQAEFDPDIATTPVPDITEQEENRNLAMNDEIYTKIYDSMTNLWPDETDFHYKTDLEYAEDSSEAVSSPMRGDYASTNVQVSSVDEGDIIKNDGRYLYQLLKDDDYNYTAVQIVDTENGLKELSKIEDFNAISDFYIWEDKAVIIENLWATEDESPQTYGSTAEICCDLAYYGNPYSNIHIYDISDRTKPEEIHTFTLKGMYRTSRISDGYLYFFSAYSTSKPEDEDDLEAYIPMVNGKLLTYESLYLPMQSHATDYLVITSVDLTEPTKFTDIMATVTWGNDYYISENHIYILNTAGFEDDETKNIDCDKTGIVKFSYEKGQIEPVAEGIVDGIVLDQFAMDEYNGFFRIITTVTTFERKEIFDDITGESLGYNVEYLSDTNSVFVLDENLNIIGSIKNLAEDEHVYSARFMGDIGYFVTFRQVDPLFSVDFSDPANPKILGELKISGFSEYLHFYEDNLLLGIGYEADEDTGRTEGVKLSMFDISNPSDVKEIHKLVLEQYDYCDAFYNHHAVLVNANKNIIGFLAEGYDGDYIREYNGYSYHAEKGFEPLFHISCKTDDYHSYDIRGTYIGDTFYLLMQNGGIKSYDLHSGTLLEELTVEE